MLKSLSWELGSWLEASIQSVTTPHRKVLGPISYYYFSEESLSLFQIVCKNNKISKFLGITLISRRFWAYPVPIWHMISLLPISSGHSEMTNF